MEVELKNRLVRPCGTEALPGKARALMTMLGPLPDISNGNGQSLGEAMRALGIVGRGDWSDLSTKPWHLDDFGK